MKQKIVIFLALGIPFGLMLGLFQFLNNGLRAGIISGVVSGLLFGLLMAFIFPKRPKYDGLDKKDIGEYLKFSKVSIIFTIFLPLLFSMLGFWQLSRNLEINIYGDVYGPIVNNMYFVTSSVGVITTIWALKAFMDLKVDKEAISEFGKLFGKKSKIDSKELLSLNKKSKFLKRITFIGLVPVIIYALVYFGTEGFSEYASNKYREEKYGVKYELSIKTDNGKRVKITTNGSKYELETKGNGFITYTNNPEKTGSSSDLITYFDNSDVMYRYLSGNQDFNIEKEIESNVDPIYLKRVTKKGDPEYGVVIQRADLNRMFYSDTGSLFDLVYIKNYVNWEEDSVKFTNKSEISSIYCALRINEGYVLIHGQRPIGSLTNDYCELIKNMKDFNIEIK